MSLPNSPPSNLVKSGRGLPWYQHFVARYVVFPAFCQTTSFDDGVEIFGAEAARIEELCAFFTPRDFVQRVPVSAVFGLEDTANRWSAAMLVEHVTTVGENVGKILVFLSRDQAPPFGVELDATKPRDLRGVSIMTDFRAFVRDYPRLVRNDLGDRRSRRRHEHPWFGPLDVHRWHCFAAFHLRIHRRHLQKIRRRLENDGPRREVPSVLLDPAADLDAQP